MPAETRGHLPHRVKRFSRRVQLTAGKLRARQVRVRFHADLAVAWDIRISEGDRLTRSGHCPFGIAGQQQRARRAHCMTCSIPPVLAGDLVM
jgi:hypothetical protein